MPLSLIPQVFYDLIARVIPGMVLLTMWYLTILGPNKAIDAITMISSQSNQNIFNFWSFAVLLTISYLVGIILDEIWTLTFRRIKRQERRRRRVKYIDRCLVQNDQIRKCLGEPELGLERRDLPPLHILHDHLRFHSQSESYRLLKLRAEARLSKILFTGFFLLPVINVLFWYWDSRLLMLDRIVLELALIVAIVILWRAGDRFEKFYIGGTYTSWLLHSFPIQPPKRTHPHLLHLGDAPVEETSA